MKPEAQRIAIAEAMGWTGIGMSSRWLVTDPPDDPVVPCGIHPVALSLAQLPDYLNDLNAMHEAEKGLTKPQQSDYHCFILASLPESIPDNTEGRTWNYVHATAAQRAEAFLRTIGAWVDEPQAKKQWEDDK